MPASRHCFRIDTMEIKVRIERMLGQQQADKYFSLLRSYWSSQVTKSELDKVCIDLLGRQNMYIHNQLIQAIVKNAIVSNTPPPKPTKPKGSLSVKLPNGFQKSSLQSLCKDVFPRSPKKGRTPNLRERKFKDRPSPLGPHGKTNNIAFKDLTSKTQEHHSATELVSLGSRPPAEVNSVEDGEEVEQESVTPEIYSRNSVRAPLGISIHAKGTRKILLSESTPDLCTHSCHDSGELPGNSSLKSRLDQKLDKEGLKISMDCVSLLNTGLDVFLKGLLRPALQLAGSRTEHIHSNQVNYQVAYGLDGTRTMRHTQKPTRSFSASILDFSVAMELNPRITGTDWPLQLDKLSFHASDNNN